MNNIMHDYKSRFRILKGGKISLVVSAILTGTSLFASSGFAGTTNITTTSTPISGGVYSDSIINITTTGSIVGTSSDSSYGINISSMSDSDLTINNDGDISMTGSTSDSLYGINVEASYYTSSDSVLTINNSSDADISVDSIGDTYGINITEGCAPALEIQVINDGMIDIDSSTEKVYGIKSTYLDSNSFIENNGTIDVYATSDYAYGIFVEDNQGRIQNDGIINSDNVGILVTDINSGDIINNSQINISPDNSGATAGIATQYNTGTITNNGDIIVDTLNTSDFASGINLLTNTGTIINNGTITATTNGEASNTGYSIAINFSSSGTIINNGTLNGNILAESNTLTNHGTISLPYTATNAQIGNFTNSSDGILEIGLWTDQSSTIYSQLTTDTATFENGSTIAVNVVALEADQTFLAGKTFDDVVTSQTTDGLSINGTLNITDNSALLDFTYVEDGDTIDLKTVQGSSIYDSTVSGGGGTPARGNAKLLDDFKDKNSGMDEFVSELNKCTSDECVAKSVDELEVKLSAAGVASARQTAQAIAKIVRQRQNVGFGSGANSGDEIFGEKSLWFKPFGTWGEQKNKDGLSGYDITSYGFGIGFDGTNKDDQQFGTALFYSNSDVDVNDADQDADIDAFSLMLYGSVPVIDDKTKFMYQLGYSIQNTDTSRYTLLGYAKGDYKSKVATIDLELMRDYQIDSKWLLQPTVGVSYTDYNTPAYTESGAGVANLNVDKFSTSELLLNVGTVVNYKLDDNSTFKTSIDLSYDMQDKKNSVASTTQGGLQLANAESIDNGRFGYSLALGYEIALTENNNINFTYDYSGEGSSYSTNTVSLKYVYKF